jgi:glycosyltransferase involved in cell wall biosynthesis
MPRGIVEERSRVSGDPVLTVAIPTFNRNELLARNFALLAPQLTPAVRVLIIDNASPTPVSATLGALPDEVTLVRNSVNVGGNDNILRCVELCETPWIMLLGDDDTPLPDMVGRIVRDIDANPGATVLHYATKNIHVRAQEWTTRGREEFLARLDSFPNLFFMSSSVMQVAHVRGALSWAQQFTYSCAPHLALLLTAMGADSLAVFLGGSLVDWKRPEVENRISVFPIYRGLPTLLELPLSAGERRLLARHLARFLTPGSLLHGALIGMRFGGLTRREALRQYLHALRRLPLYYAPVRALWGWYLAFAILTPRLSYAIAGRIFRAQTGRTMGRHNLRLEGF